MMAGQAWKQVVAAEVERFHQPQEESREGMRRGSGL